MLNSNTSCRLKHFVHVVKFFAALVETNGPRMASFFIFETMYLELGASLGSQPVAPRELYQSEKRLAQWTPWVLGLKRTKFPRASTAASGIVLSAMMSNGVGSEFLWESVSFVAVCWVFFPRLERCETARAPVTKTFYSLSIRESARRLLATAQFNRVSSQNETTPQNKTKYRLLS